MNFAPLLDATLAIQIHVVAVIATVVLTVLQLVGRKGVTTHRLLGYAWALSMITAAASSFFIHKFKMFGPFSPIHLLSILTIVAVPLGILKARQHNVKSHKGIMLRLVFFALGGAGLVALFAPGRIMFRVLFGG